MQVVALTLKYCPGGHGWSSVLEPTNMLYIPTPKISMPVPTRNISSQNYENKKVVMLYFEGVQEKEDEEGWYYANLPMASISSLAICP